MTLQINDIINAIKYEVNNRVRLYDLHENIESEDISVLLDAAMGRGVWVFDALPELLLTDLAINDDKRLCVNDGTGKRLITDSVIRAFYERFAMGHMHEVEVLRERINVVVNMLENTGVTVTIDYADIHDQYLQPLDLLLGAIDECLRLLFPEFLKISVTDRIFDAGNHGNYMLRAELVSDIL